MLWLVHANACALADQSRAGAEGARHGGQAW
jgi:hypothetical protein